MMESMKPWTGKVITADGPVAPEALGKVQMHEHLHADMFDWEKDCLIREERPIGKERKEFLIREAVPHMKACVEQHGGGAWVETSVHPWRAWPTFYREITRMTGMHCILISGFYRQVEGGKYWAKHRAEDGISPLLLDHSVEELVEFCVREVAQGIHGTGVRAGGLKFGTSAPQMTDVEVKAARIVARAQLQTGVHITTHCTRLGAETTQLQLLEEEGVDLSRVVLGHTAWHLMNPDCRKVCLEWMKKGANFLPTNLGISDPASIEGWRPLVEAIHEVFDRGLGDRLCFGLDGAFCSESGPFVFCVAPPPPFLHMYTHTLPAFRKLGLTAAEEDWIMRRNPQRILPVQ
jgi:phosphotriesterase-related protein